MTFFKKAALTRTFLLFRGNSVVSGNHGEEI